MKNIHILPTDKPSRIYLIKSNNKLGITSNNPEFTENFGSGTQNQHIYITSDEEIKEGDYYITPNNSILKSLGQMLINVEDYKKIILTTDQDLIKDGVQTIDDDFLEWFVKNPSCESVEVYKPISKGIPLLGYKIIIPKEETKQDEIDFIANELAIEKEMFELEQELDIPSHLRWHNSKPKQETLEEVAQKYAEPYRCPATNENEYCKHDIISAFNKGAKWQQERSYSEEEVYHILAEHTAELFKGSKMTLTEWFDNIKKK